MSKLMREAVLHTPPIEDHDKLLVRLLQELSSEAGNVCIR